MNGFLAVDLGEGEFHFKASKEATSETVADFFTEIIGNYHHRGICSLEIFLDRNTTHKQKMQTLVANATAKFPIQVQFRLMPSYSPKINPTEYASHQIRLAILHHADSRTSLQQFQTRIKEFCNRGTVFTKEQIVNLLGHMEQLILKFNNLSP
ncbi:MAG: hypothetical protein HC783_16865 [Rhodobacteraceae bacterium]|nr:hypothetical protein [Paracoccaceae bacterium]